MFMNKVSVGWLLLAVGNGDFGGQRLQPRKLDCEGEFYKTVVARHWCHPLKFYHQEG